MAADLELSPEAMEGVISLLEYGRNGQIRAALTMQLDISMQCCDSQCTK